MDEPRAQRTLVKSPPELWAEVSDVDALAGHLGEFGEIRITRTEPETTVAWEGDRACGTVELEPTAWGTKVTLTALVADAPEPAAAEPEPEPEPQPEPVAEPEAEAPAPEPAPEPEVAVAPAPRRGFFARLFGRRVAEPVDSPAQPAPTAATVEMAAVEAEVAPEAPEHDEPESPAPAIAAAPEPLSPDRAEEILGAVLDDLGSAHHRPFSR